MAQWFRRHWFQETKGGSSISLWTDATNMPWLEHPAFPWKYRITIPLAEPSPAVEVDTGRERALLYYLQYSTEAAPLRVSPEWIHFHQYCIPCSLVEITAAYRQMLVRRKPHDPGFYFQNTELAVRWVEQYTLQTLLGQPLASPLQDN